MYEYAEEIIVYQTMNGGPLYKTESGVLTPTTHPVNGRDVYTTEQRLNYFNANKYASKPNTDYTAPGHGKLTGVDLSTVFVKKSWSSAEEMKTDVLSDSYLSTINTYAAHADYYLTENKGLKIKLFFETETARNNWLNAVKDRPSSQFKEQSVVVTTL
jgi:hypothetical protein